MKIASSPLFLSFSLSLSLCRSRTLAGLVSLAGLDLVDLFFVLVEDGNGKRKRRRKGKKKERLVEQKNKKKGI